MFALVCSLQNEKSVVNFENREDAVKAFHKLILSDNVQNECNGNITDLNEELCTLVINNKYSYVAVVVEIKDNTPVKEVYLQWKVRRDCDGTIRLLNVDIDSDYEFGDLLFKNREDAIKTLIDYDCFDTAIEENWELAEVTIKSHSNLL